MILGFEFFGHASTAVNTAAEGHSLQIPFEVVGPLVVRADKLGGVALIFTTKLGATVSTAVFKDVDGTVFSAGHNHRRGTNVGSFVITRIGDFCLEGYVIPRIALKDSRSEERR